MTDRSGRDYADVSSLQRAMATEAVTPRTSAQATGCSMSAAVTALTRAVAGAVPDGCVVGSRLTEDDRDRA